MSMKKALSKKLTWVNIPFAFDILMQVAISFVQSCRVLLQLNIQLEWLLDIW